MRNIIKHIRAFIIVLLLFVACQSQKNLPKQKDEPSNKIESGQQKTQEKETAKQSQALLMGAQRTELYFSEIKGKRVGLVINASSKIGNVSLLDFLLEKDIKVQKIFAPEHGFRGTAEAGEFVNNEIDKKTNLPIVSLYGKNKKPTQDQLADVDVLVFDIQDVGVRFYTYISTLHYVMEAAAQKQIPVIVLDRPNPNAHYIDGPVLEAGYTSFIGMHPSVPVVYGMTIGEYALMINGEAWLKSNKVDLKVIPIANYTHNTPYSLPVAPSPNLRNDHAIALYPSLCFFEGTFVSVGRGTDHPFEIYGAPMRYWKDDKVFAFEFKPSSEGKIKPPHNKESCFGEDLRRVPKPKKIHLEWLIKAYKAAKNKDNFFLKGNFIDKLAGSACLKAQIQAGLSEVEIRKSWQLGIYQFKAIRAKYLLYPE